MVKLKKRSFIIYLKSLLQKWILYLGFIPYVYDLISTYLPEPFKDFRFPIWVIHTSILLSLFIASYFTWLELKNKIDEHLSNETSFKIKPLIYKLTGEQYLSDIKKRIERYKDEIQILDNIDSSNTPLTGIGFLLKMPNINPFNPKPKKEDYEKWINDLEILENKINNFLSNNKNLFLFNFTISANRYDENIEVKTIIDDSGELISIEDINLPIEKKRPSASLFDLTPKSLKPLTNNNQEKFRQHIGIGKNSARCNLKYLKKDFAYFFMNDYLIIKIINKETNLKVFINSKFSNGTKEYNLQIRESKIIEKKDLSEFKEMS